MTPLFAACRGSSASRSASPSRLKPSTAAPIASPGEDGRPRRVAQLIEVASVGDHRAPARRRRLHAEPEERQRRFGHDRRRDAERGRDEHRRDDARQHVLQHDADVARAERLGRLHELELAHDEHLAANEPRHPRPADDADREEHDGQRRLQRGGHRDEQQQRGKRERHVGEAHHQLVDPAAVVAGEQPEREAEQQRDGLRDDARGERDARAVHEPRPHVAPLDVGAQPVRRATAPGAGSRGRSPAGRGATRAARAPRAARSATTTPMPNQARTSRRSARLTRSFMRDLPAPAACPAADASSGGDARNTARARVAPSARACACTRRRYGPRRHRACPSIRPAPTRSASTNRPLGCRSAQAKTSGVLSRSANTAGPRGVLA